MAISVLNAITKVTIKKKVQVLVTVNRLTLQEKKQDEVSYVILNDSDVNRT